MYSSKYGMVTVTCLASPVLPCNSQTSGRRTKEAKERLEAKGKQDTKPTLLKESS
jgi:hypothetical protein